MLSALVSLLALAGLSSAAVQTIQVGAGGLQFTPSTVTAAAGDIISFQYAAGGIHSVTQSTFASPCQAMTGGFDSGVVTDASGPLDMWNLTVTDATTPIWFYCKSVAGGAPHCTAGMVGAINPPATGNTFAMYQAAAKSATFPSQPTGSALSGVGASATAFPATAAAAAATGTAPASAPTASTTTSGSVVSKATLATVVVAFIGVVAGMAL